MTSVPPPEAYGTTQRIEAGIDTFAGYNPPDATWAQVLFIIAVGALLSVPGLPFEWWAQFRIEQKFGFNQSTPALWVTDKIKGAVLAVVIGYPLLWVLLCLFSASQRAPLGQNEALPGKVLVKLSGR